MFTREPTTSLIFRVSSIATQSRAHVGIYLRLEVLCLHSQFGENIMNQFGYIIKHTERTALQINIYGFYNMRIKHEVILHRDILQLNITDRYAHLTIKSLSGLLWIAKHCPQSSYMIKCDDDSYLNMKNIIKYLVLLNSNTERIHGFVYRHPRVMRTGLWAVPKEVCTKDYYPDYCSGNTYVIPSSVVPKLLTCLYQQYTTHLHIEDVYITGVLAKCANITLHHDSRFPSWISTPSLTTIQALVQGLLFGLHGADYARMYPLHVMLRNCNKCVFNQSQLQYWFQMIKNTSPVL